MPRLKSFSESESGTVAMIFALIVLSAFILIGGGLDFSRHRTQSIVLQTALDSTALYMLRETQLNDDDFQLAARRFFDANLSGFDATLTEFNVQRTTDSVTAMAAADVETSFLGLMGIETLETYRFAEGILSTETREVVLVLDTTGSMSGSKLADLQSASNLLLDNLEEAAVEANNIQVGIIPFSKWVRVDPSEFQDNWLDDEGRSDIANEIFGTDINLLDLFDHLGEPWGGCIRTRGGDLAFTDDPIIAGDPNTRFKPLFAYDEGDDGSYRNNYLTDAIVHPDGISSVQSFLKYGIEAGEENDTNSWDSVIVDSSLGKGPNFQCNSEPIIPLTNNFGALRTSVNGLTANGSTNLTESLVWGLRVLSDHAPYTEGLPDDAPGNRKILIFLSDGNNNSGSDNSDLLSLISAQGYAGFGDFSAQLPPNPSKNDRDDYLDDEFVIACQTVKNAGIQLIVIRLELDDNSSQTLLSECATSEADYFDVPDSSQLEGVFSQISQRVTEARLAR